MKVFEWEAGIGDPTLLGWFTVGAYVVAGLLCWVAAARARGMDRRAYGFWVVLVVFMFALGINKQLDLQSLFTAVLKQFANTTGWYEDRRIFQGVFVVIIALFGLAFAALAWIWTSRALPRHRLALVGGIFLGCFIVVRASSFHHFDQILGISIAFLRMNHVLELGGIACVALAAFRSLRENPAAAGPRKAPGRHSWKGSASGYPR